MAPGVPDSPVSETAQSTVAAASVAEIAGRRQEVELPRGPASVGNRGAMRQKDYQVATSAASEASHKPSVGPSKYELQGPTGSRS
jgi:hypothetical protein